MEISSWSIFINLLTKFIIRKNPCQYFSRPCLPGSLLIFSFEGKTWTGPGDGDAICESTGRGFSFHRRNQRVSAKRGGGPAAPPLSMEKSPPRGFAKRGAVPVPLRGLRSIRSHFVFLKVNQGGKFSRLT